jgi:Dyp-type peroxidase family
MGRVRDWLAEIATRTNAGPVERKCLTRAVNVAFSHRGLAACGLELRARAEFGPAFRKGMSGSKHRSRALGDVGECAPEKWRWGKEPKHVDAVLMLFAADGAELGKLLDEAQELASDYRIKQLEPPLRAAWPKAPCHYEGLREHFGFVDGISQPKYRLRADDHCEDHLAPGELLLGYPNEAHEIAPGPTVRATPLARSVGLRLTPDGDRCDFGRGGSYLVLREIAQDVIGFWRFAKSANPALTMECCAAKLVGRWRNGDPLTRVPQEPKDFFKVDRPHNNDFAFLSAEDGEGFGCPYGAHIRRANPRDTLPGLAERGSLSAVRRRRILRRGRPFGDHVPGWPDPEEMLNTAQGDTTDAEWPRGLYFACLNADIEEQFERVQQRWLNDPTFVNGRSTEVDAVLGHGRSGAQFVVPTTSGPLLLGNEQVPLRRFVTVRGGEYFFLPSKSALSYLAGVQDEA